MRIEIIEACGAVKTLHAANAQRFTTTQHSDVIQTVPGNL